MIVMKFGGTSVKDAHAVDRVAAIIEGRLADKPVIVVSALGKTTDMLAAVLEALAQGHAKEAREFAASIEDHHRQVVNNVLKNEHERAAAMEAVDSNMAKLGRLMDGMECLGEVSARSSDSVLSLGECMAAPLLAAFLSSRGFAAEPADPRKLIVTDSNHGAASPLVDETARRCAEALEPMLGKNKLPVVGGYVGATPEGIVTTLGRGGSDLTASLIAKALKAKRLEFWKDVDGILTADPNLVPEARPVEALTFREAAELAFLGARVLHPASIQPAVEAGIPIRVLNSYRSESPGTAIFKLAADDDSGSASKRQTVSSIAYKRGQFLVNVYSTRMLGAPGFLRRVFEVFDRMNLSVDHIATSEVNVTVTLGPTKKIEFLKAELGEVAKIDIEPGVGVVSIVGERMPNRSGIAARIFRALDNVNVKLITYGGSGVNLSLVVGDDDVPGCVRALHSEFWT